MRGVHFIGAGVRFAGTVLLGQKAGRGGETAGEERELVAEAGNQVFRVSAHFPFQGLQTFPGSDF